MLFEAQVINSLIEHRKDKYQKIMEEQENTIYLPFEMSEALTNQVIKAAEEIDREQTYELESFIVPIKYESKLLKNLKDKKIDIEELVSNSRKQ